MNDKRICPHSGLQILTVEHIVWFALYYLNIVVQPHQRVWLAFLIGKGKRKHLEAPRGHGKTTTLIEVLLVYMICYFPDIKILLASHKEAVAKRQARMIQVHLERKKIKEDFSITKGSPWRRDEFYIKEHGLDKPFPCVFVCAGQGGMTGYRFDWIVFDDLLVMDNSKSDVLRAKLLEWIENEVFKARDPSEMQKIIVVGTRKHVKDWYSQLLDSKFWDCHVDRAIQEDGSTLWPYRLDANGEIIKTEYDHAELEDRKVTEGARAFAQEYMNRPAPAEGLLLRREWIKTHEELPPDQFLDVYMGVDPSFGSTRDRASSLAIAVIAADRRVDNHMIYVIELFKAQMPLNEQMAKIVDMYNTYNPVSCNIESVLINSSFANHVIDTLPNFYPIDYMHSRLKGTSEVSKDARIQNLIGWYFSEGQVSMPDPKYNHNIREFIETEYIEFPDGEKDLLDALNLAVDLVDMSVGTSSVPLYGF